MPVAPGTLFGPYEVLSAIGAGGMGEVYKARDTRLDRSVALKVSKADFGDRFEREARAVAALNHPHICSLFDVGPNYLVMELVQGVPLEGPLPVGKAVEYASQILDALDAAHKKGITHRDLKPANILVTKQGIKLLDFGLAMQTTGPVSDTDLTRAAPFGGAHTGEGQIVGTLQYMAPEQLQGQPADARSDIFAFGCVLYELLSGKRAFEGTSPASVIAAILEREPAPLTVVPLLDRVIKTCLAKNPDDRFQTALDLKRNLAWATEATGPGVDGVSRRSRRRVLPAAAVGVALFVAGASLLLWASASSAPAPVARFSFTLEEGQQFLTAGSGRQLFAVSPDGTRIVYEADGRLFQRAISDFESRPIPGTDSNSTGRINSPVFSPDGQAVAFHQGSRLSRIALTGGSVTTLCEVPNLFDVMWDREWIFFTTGLEGAGRGAVRLMRVPANGGDPTEILKVGDDEFIGHADILPGGARVLLTIATRATGSAAAEATVPGDESRIVIHTFASGQRTTLVEKAGDGRYLPTGHLVFARDGVVYAAPFDAEAGELPGSPVPVIEGVRRGSRGRAWWTASASGTLVYLPGPASTALRRFRLAFMDRQGRTDVLAPPPMEYEAPRVSPDGARVAVGVDGASGSNVWIYELAGTSAMQKLTLTGRNRDPVWSPGSDRVAFQSDRAGDLGIYAQRADGTGPAERLTTSGQGTAHFPESWSPDGKWLLFTASTGGRASLHVLSLGDRKVVPFVGAHRGSPRMGAAFSPDGRWVAYNGGRGSDARQLFVEPFPQTGAKYEVARGTQPFWSRDGRELFFVPGSRRFSVVTVTTAPRFSSSQSVALPRGEYIDPGPSSTTNLGIGPDDQRFIVVIEADSTLAQARPRINVVLNWFRELNERVPVGK